MRGTSISFENKPRNIRDLVAVARPAGLEPATPRLGIWCSIRLSYGRAGRGVYSIFGRRRQAGGGAGLFRAEEAVERQGIVKRDCFGAGVLVGQ